MPAVTGMRLDAALAEIERAGFDGEVQIDGGGTFGVIDESNWQVCSQSPAAGQAMSDAPELAVDRSCGSDATTETSSPATDAAPVSSVEPATTAAPVTINVMNNAEFAAVLSDPDYTSDAVATFSAKYAGELIEFDGVTANTVKHEGRDTRFDILIFAGDSSTVAVRGPSFQFRDVGVFDLNGGAPDSGGMLAVDSKLHVVARVVGYEDGSGLFVLDPVQVTPRG